MARLTPTTSCIGISTASRVMQRPHLVNCLTKVLKKNRANPRPLMKNFLPPAFYPRTLQPHLLQRRAITLQRPRRCQLLPWRLIQVAYCFHILRLRRILSFPLRNRILTFLSPYPIRHGAKIEHYLSPSHTHSTPWKGTLT